MRIMIMKPHLRSMWEENIEDLVRGKFPNSMVLMNQIFYFRRCRPMWSFKIASFRLHPVWGTYLDDPVVTITEVLPLPTSRTIGNVGVITWAGQPSLAEILSQIDASLWLYNDNYGRRPSYIKYKRWWYVYFDSTATVYQLKVAHRWLLPPCRCYAGCFRNNKTTLSRRLGDRRRLC